MRANTKTMETEQQPSENSLPMVVNPEDQKINPQVKRIRKYKRGTHSPEPNNFRLK